MKLSNEEKQKFANEIVRLSAIDSVMDNDKKNVNYFLDSISETARFDPNDFNTFIYNYYSDNYSKIKQKIESIKKGTEIYRGEMTCDKDQFLHAIKKSKGNVKSRYWSWSIDNARPYIFKSCGRDSGDIIFLKARVNKRSIDEDATMLVNLNFKMEETEIRTKKNENIKVTEVCDYDRKWMDDIHKMVTIPMNCKKINQIK